MHVNVAAATLISVEGAGFALISVEEAGFVDTATNNGQNDADGRRSAIVSHGVYMEYMGWIRL